MLNFQGTVYIRNRITYSLPFKGGSILLVNPGSVLSINQQFVKHILFDYIIMKYNVFKNVEMKHNLFKETM